MTAPRRYATEQVIAVARVLLEPPPDSRGHYCQDVADRSDVKYSTVNMILRERFLPDRWIMYLGPGRSPVYHGSNRQFYAVTRLGTAQLTRILEGRP